MQIRFRVASISFVFLASMAHDISADEKAYVGRFANGVTVELIGIGMNPSAKAEWWKPDGSPLADRPYAKFVPKQSFKPQTMEREICFRRTGTLDFEVNRGLRTIPGDFEQDGTPYNIHSQRAEEVEAAIITFNEKTRMCTVRFLFTYEASPWATVVEANAGDSFSDASPDGKVRVGFMPPRQDGSDTVVTAAYTGFGDTRLVAIDTKGRESMGKLGEDIFVGNTRIVEYRFANKRLEDLKKWRFQKRRLATDKIEFQNVALEPGIDTDVQIDVISAEEENRVKRKARQQELVNLLAEDHGYALKDGERLKYLANAESKPRSELYYLAMNEHKWAEPPDEYPFETFTLMFQSDAAGQLKLDRSLKGITTLADILQNAFWLMTHQYDCPDGLLNAYIPGDWILSKEHRSPRDMTDAELAALENILNNQLNLGVKVCWKHVERPTLVISGIYKARPEEGKYSGDENLALQSDGVFLVDARRALSFHPELMIGTFEELTDSLGYLLKLPVVNEAKTQPVKKLITWNETGKPVEGDERLAPGHEDRVLKSLHEQLGYEFTIEPREVKLLSIEQVEP